MKILILCKKFPYPLKEGEPIAISYLSRSLKEKGCSVSLLVLNTSKHYFDPKQFPDAENHFDEIHSVEVNNNITVWGAAKSLINGSSYILSRFYSLAFEQKLKELLLTDVYDVVQLETIYMAHYIPTIRESSQAVISIRAHNVEHKIWEQVAATSGLFKRWYLTNQNVFLKKFELEKINHCDILVAITDADLKNFEEMGFHKKAVSVPVGFDMEKYLTDFSPGPEQQSIAFIGALDWMPNQDGVVWFLENVWPIISSDFPNLEFHIAGKNTPQWIKQKSTGRVIVHGEVPDAKAFIKKHPVLIAPLFSGSGIKIKVLEGLALGRVVITTSIGAEGIPVLDKEHFFKADTAAEFCQVLRQCFSSNIDLLKIRQAGRSFIQKRFDSGYLAGKTIAAYQMLLDEKHK